MQVVIATSGHGLQRILLNTHTLTLKLVHFVDGQISLGTRQPTIGNQLDTVHTMIILAQSPRVYQSVNQNKFIQHRMSRANQRHIGRSLGSVCFICTASVVCQ